MMFRLVLVGWSRHTEVYLIVLEAVTKFGMVDLENFPILHKMMFTDAESDGWGAVVEFFSVRFHLIEQYFKCLHRFVRFVQYPLSLNPCRLGLLNVDSVGISLNPSICFLQSLTLMPCLPILSLIESTRPVKALLPNRRTSLGWLT